VPRNRSEKSPSGDTMVDDYLRAWLRWYRDLKRGYDPATHTANLLQSDRERLLTLLSDKQHRFINIDLSSSGTNLSHSDVVRLYGDEAEFQNGT